MTNTRVRYDQKSDNTLVSRRKFALPNGIEVYIELNTVDKKYTIRDAVTEVVMAEGNHTRNLSVLKIKAKASLEDLGYQFVDETRERGETSTDDMSGIGLGLRDN